MRDRTRPRSTDACAVQEARVRIDAALYDGAMLDDALAVFDALPPVPVEAVLGRWRGRGLHTGHPLDGALEAFGWHGKDLHDPGSGFPLLFADGRGRIVAIDPAWLPLQAAARWRLQDRRLAHLAFPLLRRLLRTGRPGARLRTVRCRGVDSAALVYDRLPVIDALRVVDADRLLGLMDARGFDRPLLFVLERERLAGHGAPPG